MTNTEIFEIAMRQSAIDSNCNPADFLQSSDKVVRSAVHPDARRYLNLPFDCDLVSYGNNIVASTSDDLADFVTAYINKFRISGCFETPNICILNNELIQRGLQIYFMAEYFLPDVTVLTELNCNYETRLLYQADFAELYTDEWSNALLKKRKHLDVLGVGAYDGDTLVGLAACSADCDTIWQIGVDVLPEYRRNNIACCLTSRLASAILERGKVPFYCAAWSNIKSVRNAIKSGFRPAWVEITAKPLDFDADVNKQV